jgi:ATP-dependent DNA helicase DinG
MNGKTVVIVTANIALQEQLVQKDLPLLTEVLPWGFSFGLLKGRNNYLCRSQYEKVNLATSQVPMFGDRYASGDDRDKVRLLAWAKEVVAGSDFGDVSSLDWKPTDKLWRELSVASDECKGGRCAFAETCVMLGPARSW